MKPSSPIASAGRWPTDFSREVAAAYSTPAVARAPSDARFPRVVTHLCLALITVAAVRTRFSAGGRWLGNHGFRATGITACLKNGGTLEKAAAMPNPCLDAHDATLRSPTR